MCERHLPTALYRQPLPVHVGFAGTRQLLSIAISPSIATICHCSDPSDGGQVAQYALRDHPDREFANYIVEGTRSGFLVGFQGTLGA